LAGEVKRKANWAQAHDSAGLKGPTAPRVKVKTFLKKRPLS